MASLYIVDFVQTDEDIDGDDDGGSDYAMTDAEDVGDCASVGSAQSVGGGGGGSTTVVTIQVCTSVEQARELVRRHIELDLAALDAIGMGEAIESDGEGPVDHNNNSSIGDGAFSDAESVGDASDDGAFASFEPSYESVEVHGNYRITQVVVGKYYGWHDLSSLQSTTVSAAAAASSAAAAAASTTAATTTAPAI